MVVHDRPNPRTAAPDQSIWRDLPEDTFRNHLVTLQQRTNAVPVPSQLFSVVENGPSIADEARLLVIEVEHKLADDFAYIASTGQGAQSVSAACIEEYHNPPSLRICFAAVDAIDEQLRHAIEKVGHILSVISRTSACEDNREETSKLLNLIVKLHFQKLLGRLRSAKWKKPTYLARTHKKALWQDFDNLIHRAQFAYPRKKNPIRIEVTEQLQATAMLFQKFEDMQTESDDEFGHMLNLVKTSHDLCTSPAVRDFAAKLEVLPKATPQIAASIKTLRQLEKIGAYYRIAVDLVAAANCYPSLFRKIEFVYVSPYLGIPTDIGFESWAKTLHIHAEIQLAVHYDLMTAQLGKLGKQEEMQRWGPRVIGTSKYLCYLCYLFLKYHETFIPANTHGRLYDQWTIPDLDDFDENIREKYRSVIKSIDVEIVSMSDVVGPTEGKRDPWRVEPMTSRQNLLLTTHSQM